MTGTELKALRTRLKLSNAELAARLGVSGATVEAYLYGIRGMSATVAERAARLQDPTRCPTCQQVLPTARNHPPRHERTQR